MFIAVLGALGKLVVLSMMLERGLAFIFEHDWFVGATTKEVVDPTDANKKKRESYIPGLRGFLALAAALSLCFGYNFDVLSVIFGRTEGTWIGIVVTAFVAAGGSAGALTIFQGFLNISKESREGMMAARKAEMDAALAEAKAKKEKAEAERAEAEARKKVAENQVARIAPAR